MIESVMEGDEGINRKNYKEDTDFIFKGDKALHTENTKKYPTQQKKTKILKNILHNKRKRKARSSTGMFYSIL